MGFFFGVQVDGPITEGLMSCGGGGELVHCKWQVKVCMCSCKDVMFSMVCFLSLC